MSTRSRRKTTSPSTPKIINLPTRRHTTRRRKPRTTAPEEIQTYNYKGKLASLFGEEREFSRPPDELVQSPEEVAEERWRFQAEILRAECEFLRMERKLAMKNLEKNRIGIERTLKSALKTVDFGRKKLCEGMNMEVVLDEAVKQLSEKLEELQSGYNGDWSTSTNGMLDQMEKDYRSIINNSVASSASTSNRIDFSEHLSVSNRFSNQAKDPLVSQKAKCSGRCKLLVRRMVEQVRAETEQWSQMQVMLGQLRQDMEELQTSKNFWETQALVSNQEIQSLMTEVEEWREKAVAYETKANTLQTEVNLVKGELEKLNDQVKEINSTPEKEIVSLSKQIERETKNGWSCRMHVKVEQRKKDSQPMSLGKQLAREKQILISRLKENPSNNDEILGYGRRKGCHLVRSPFKDIGNSSPSSMGMDVW